MYLTKRYKGSSVIAAIELDMSTVSVRSEIDGGARVAPKSFESGAEETEARDEPAAGDADELAAALDEPALEETADELFDDLLPDVDVLESAAADLACDDVLKSDSGTEGRDMGPPTLVVFEPGDTGIRAVTMNANASSTKGSQQCMVYA